MSRTYRALAIVAVVVTVVTLVAAFTYDPGRGWYSYAPLTLSWTTLYPMILNGAWLTTASIAPPVIGTFGAVVAAQGRHRVWMSVFIALGLLGLYGPSALSLLAIELGLLLRFVPDQLGNGLPIIVLQALPAIAALLFVATTSRPARITSGHANP